MNPGPSLKVRAAFHGAIRGLPEGRWNPMSKRDLSEADICAKFITPNVEKAGWDEATQVRR
jgi:hypothetical protein